MDKKLDSDHLLFLGVNNIYSFRLILLLIKLGPSTIVADREIYISPLYRCVMLKKPFLYTITDLICLISLGVQDKWLYARLH